MNKLFLFALVFLSQSATHGADYYLTKNFVVQTLGTNALIMSEISTGTVTTNTFATNIYKVESSCAHDYLSLQRDSLDDEKEFVVYGINDQKIYSFPYLRNLDIDERRWSVHGQYTYIQKGISFGIMKTSMFFHSLENNLPLIYEIEVEGDPFGYIFQEENGWLNERFLLFGTGQGEKIAWGVLDIQEREVYFLDIIGVLGKPPLTNENRSIDRLMNLMHKLLSTPPQKRERNIKYFKVIRGRKLGSHLNI